MCQLSLSTKQWLYCWLISQSETCPPTKSPVLSYYHFPPAGHCVVENTVHRLTLHVLQQVIAHAIGMPMLKQYFAAFLSGKTVNSTRYWYFCKINMEDECVVSIFLKNKIELAQKLDDHSNTGFCFEGQSWWSRRERPSWEACKYCFFLIAILCWISLLAL